MTSLYQVTLRNTVVDTLTAKRKRVRRWFYMDMYKALDPSTDREEAIITLPEDRVVRSDFGRAIDLDLSTPEGEYANCCYPIWKVFDWDDWQDGFNDFWNSEEKKQLFRAFKNEVLANFKSYQVPVIALGNGTSKEAVCVVFEKVNTGGKPLDAFELVTAMYAADGHELRKDWYGSTDVSGRHSRFV